MLTKQRARGMGYRCLIWMVLMSVVAGFSSPAAAGWYQLPSFLMPPDAPALSGEEDPESREQGYDGLLFYIPDVYETHRITGYSAVVLAVLAMVSGDDSSLHKVSGGAAAAFGVAAGVTGHSAYGEGIDFRQGWTRENTLAGSGYLATAALVLTAALGASDKNHAAAGGIATAAVVVPVIVFRF